MEVFLLSLYSLTTQWNGMERNQAYGVIQQNNQPPTADNTYEAIDGLTTKKGSARKEGCTGAVYETSKVKNSSKVCLTLGIAVTTAVLALVVAVVAVVLNPVLKSSQEIHSLELKVEEVKMLQLSLNYTVQKCTKLLLTPGTINNPASSCSNLLPNSPSGKFWVLNSNTNSLVQVYCDMTRTCCNTTGGWMRVANIDMSDSSQQCPDGFRLVTRTTVPLRTCGRPRPRCVSTTFPVHGIKYSQICGLIRGYQYGSPDAFGSYRKRNLTIDDYYVDGVSITHGQSPRQHIWTFAAALDETRANRLTCPCTQPDLNYTGAVPPFIGQDYFCETGSRQSFQYILYSDDPLWDGQGCGGKSTCCSFNNPPWFCKQLPQSTTDDIELRVCGDEVTSYEDTPLETVKMYIK